MRIRKNKKLSEMGYQGLHTAYDCQLNQSPWDVISQQSFPSSFNLLQSSDNSDGNCYSAAVCVSPSFEKSEGGNEMAGGVSGSNRQEERGESDTETAKKGKLRRKDSDNEWEGCQKIEGSDECCGVNLSGQKHEKGERRNFLATKRLARQPNKFRSSNSTTNGFYYYSGFGPSWPKNAQD